MDLAGQRVVVVGLARSGIAAARFLAGRGAQVVATDVQGTDRLGEEVLSLPALGVSLETGGHRRESFLSASLVVTSPGVPWELPELEAARKAGVPVMAELELGVRFIPGPVAAVTGTKGKSTTTAALGAMLAAAGRDVRVGGNIGAPLTGLLEGATAETTFVLEVSSFQLEGTETLRPKVAVFLNLSADHLDRHPSFEAYAAAKARIFRNQTATDWAVVNAEDDDAARLAAQGRARIVGFGREDHPGDAAFFQAGAACLRLDGRTERLFPRADVRLPGEHLASDLLAAAAAARLLGAPTDAIGRAVADFRGAEHVLERVGERGGVAFFNDSKATNVAAARRSLESFDRPVLAILGGRHKGGDFAELRDVVSRHARALFLIGEARPVLAAALEGTVPLTSCGSLAEAVRAAAAAARPGDVVLLAPGCSSFDMFRDYADRGRAFKAEAARLIAGGAD